MPFRRRDGPPAACPWLAREDVLFAAELPLLWAMAIALPGCRRAGACRRLGAAKAALRFVDSESVARVAARALAAPGEAFYARAFGARLDAWVRRHPAQCRDWKNLKPPS